MRALRYLHSGFSVHLRGPAGTGKTTLALHLADLLGRPMMLLFGDDEFKTSDLIGNQSGYTRKKVVDNFIHSVVKVEDELRQNWVDSRLTLACREGFTLVYDEFNRSRPEVNNVLLSALEEKLLVLPPNNNRSEYIRVSPQFRAIFTSNPEEYCGVHDTQDALLDRLITINMPEPDELTQQEIAVHKTGIDRESALLIVQLVKAFRSRTGADKASGLRACLMLAKICHEHEILALPENPEFRDICQDVLLSRSGLQLSEATQILWEVCNQMIAAHAVQLQASNYAPRSRLIPKTSVTERVPHPAETMAEVDEEADQEVEEDIEAASAAIDHPFTEPEAEQPLVSEIVSAAANSLTSVEPHPLEPAHPIPRNKRSPLLTPRAYGGKDA
jgi:gas vesicle protein GvpN